MASKAIIARMNRAAALGGRGLSLVAGSWRNWGIGGWFPKSSIEGAVLLRCRRWWRWLPTHTSAGSHMQTRAYAAAARVLQGVQIGIPAVRARPTRCAVPDEPGNATKQASWAAATNCSLRR